MKIQNIVDVSKEFLSFSQSLAGLAYNVNFEVKKFLFRGNKEFLLNNLKNLFSKENVEGYVELYNFKDVILYVREALRIQGNKHFGGTEMLKDKRKITKREQVFWNLVNKNFHLPPALVYKHIPVKDSYFGSYVMWGFCYIFLNKDGTGLVLSGEAFD